MAARSRARSAAPTEMGRSPQSKPQAGTKPARLNALVHARMRLAILSSLAVTRELSFSELKRHLEASDGNLSLHARKLEEAGYIECEKLFEKRIPKTIYRITAAGRQALDGYLAHMEAIIQATRTGS